MNTIIGITGPFGCFDTSFYDIAREGCSYFKGIFKQEDRVMIEKALQVSRHFPHFVKGEDNDMLMEEVSKKEL